ncbi:DUF3857 domain-containing transglutaminase family protein [Amantichitinum ursilacus]|uniref:Transglutaminase-like superfamily protein n=1 Tax=Amantichitinum ursilacus TaxID=857265 RepID=A0A0N1JSN6_9NEIS|nr:DUF3857 and transglutaminase domain-containing protein [Amantichitinum ursilacus]KPC52866.1 Transglutaminase-like superfamily protein [Amantichitinum ursilacus]
MNKSAFRVATLALLSALSGHSFAEGQGHVRVVWEKHDVVINADHTYTDTVDLKFQAVDQGGASSLGQQYLSYQRGRQALDILAAETVHADGSVVAVPEQGFKTQDGMLGGVSMPENQLIQITFPRVSPGDAVHYRYRFTRKETDLPNGMSMQLGFDDAVVHDNVSVRIDYPAELALQTDVVAMQPHQESAEPGRKRISFSYANKTTVTREGGETDGWQQTPHVYLTTFADWKAVADAYQSRANEKAAVTPEVQKLADDITSGVTGQRQQASALYDWVRRNIRYIAVYVGAGGMVPHDTATILANHYGDCKDHATLLEALLRAKGIESSQVLITADTRTYKLPSVPVAGWFNHDINYVPSLGLFLDSTADLAPFGVLPETDLSKPVLITRDFNGVRNTPVGSPLRDRVVRRTTIKIAPDGSATRATDIIGFGIAGMTNRQFLDSIGGDKLHEWASRNLAESGMEGDANLELLPQTHADESGYRLTQHIANYVDQPEAGTLGFVSAREGPISLGNILTRFQLPQRTRNFACSGFGVDDEVQIELPNTMHVVYLPRDVEIQRDAVSMSARYSQTGNTVKLVRHFALDTPGASCSPAEFAALKPVMKDVERATHGRLVYVSGDAAAAEAMRSGKSAVASR